MKAQVSAERVMGVMCGQGQGQAPHELAGQGVLWAQGAAEAHRFQSTRADLCTWSQPHSTLLQWLYAPCQAEALMHVRLPDSACASCAKHKPNAATDHSAGKPSFRLPASSSRLVELRTATPAAAKQGDSTGSNPKQCNIVAHL